MRLRADRQCALCVCALMLLGGGQAGAQSVYRCGPDANMYTHTPCPGGNGRVVDVADPRDAAQWSDATDVAQRAAEAGLQLERERRHNEARQAQGKATRIAGSDSARDEHPPGQADVRRAIAPKATCGASKATAKAGAPRSCIGKQRSVRLNAPRPVSPAKAGTDR